ncbi:hypothetical protein Taro_053128 [Colocasia esculenta]|uniref:Stigma-specific STIG1-like protein 1 n=1 Tax=Colocasia esculenta TaxID=4460 RepID=A0A843XM54_COLES|nr:hypothetical protein [Colocasia esculenta]
MEVRRTISISLVLSAFVVLCLFLSPTPSMASDAGNLPEIKEAGENVDQVMAASISDQYGGEEGETPSSLRRFLHSHHPRFRVTCDWYPKICRANGSPGRTCCRRRCVDLKSDHLNCGRCGRRCRYGEACCNGRCINVMFDTKNCGWCNRKCRNRGRCRFGMCSYAGGGHRH